MTVLTAGWAWPANARKAHWFDEGEAIALCGKWMFTGERSTGGLGPGLNPYDCATCVKKLNKRGGA